MSKNDEFMGKLILVFPPCGVKGWLGVGFCKICQIDNNESRYLVFLFYNHDYNDVLWNYRLMQMKQAFSCLVVT